MSETFSLITEESQVEYYLVFWFFSWFFVEILIFSLNFWQRKKLLLPGVSVIFHYYLNNFWHHLMTFYHSRLPDVSTAQLNLCSSCGSWRENVANSVETKVFHKTTLIWRITIYCYFKMLGIVTLMFKT